MSWKPVILLVTIWGILFGLLEGASWLVLKLNAARSPSDNPLVREYMARGYPLFVDNDDLRVREQEFAVHPFFGYAQVPGHVTVRPHGDYVTRIEVDAAGFVHTGDSARNPTALAQPKGRSYRVAFVGGSTMFGLGASRNETTIPAWFEQDLRRRWPGVNFLVLNAGAQGYQSTQERLVYELSLEDLDPDLLVVLDGFNDAMIAGDSPVWRPHFNFVNVIDGDRFVALHRPLVRLANSVRSLVAFPEPLASLALLRRVLSRLQISADGVGGAPRKGYYHPEAADQYADNLRAMALHVSEGGRLGLFALQPFLGHAKGGLTEAERRILDGYGERVEAFNRHYADFAPVFSALGERFSRRGVQFVDIRSLFADTDEQLYSSIVHYNDKANGRIAAVLLDAIAPRLEDDLRQKELIR